MAEIDFEEDIEDEDLIEEDIPDEIDEETQEETSQKTGLLSNTRNIIIVAVIGIVLICAIGLVSWRLLNSDGPSKGKSKQATVVQEEKKQKKKKKKKQAYVLLVDGITGAQMTPILRELSFESILFQTTGSGKNRIINVEKDQLEEAKNLLAIRGLPETSKTGYQLLDDAATLGVTEFDKRIRFLRALSGELENAIMQMRMIETCKVQIVLPEQRLFAVTQPPVTASILIRKKNNEDITDDLVFSIIQLVSNSVENLQQENVSVITTEGFVLSTGIFERIAARDAGEMIDEPGIEIEEIPPTDNQLTVGEPFIPELKDIKKWYAFKQKYEDILEEKANKQLIGIIPENSFKVAITADLGHISDGENVDVRRLTTSIVVDNNNDDVFLDVLMKKQIFNTVAGAIGYQRGRDTIQLNKADFSIYDKKSPPKKEKGKTPFWITLLKWLLYATLIGAGAWGVFKYLKKKRTKPKEEMPAIVSEETDEERPTDFEDLQNEIVREKQEEKVINLATENPAIVATVMEEWINTEEEVPI